MGTIHKYLIALKHVSFALLIVIFTISAFHFPYDTDAPQPQPAVDAARNYYTAAYQQPITESEVTAAKETEYMRVAAANAQGARIEEQVRAFVNRFNLHHRPVLEIGSGRGYLQDVAQNYTGLDISPTVSRFYHKKFVLGSATSMPFPDDGFDGVWSIWVFEHITNPEQALHEARRVTRDKGLLFLFPAWDCPPWAAEGYEARPYSDFDLAGKIIKASIPLRSSEPFRAMTLIPKRMIRSLVARFGPTRLRYRRLSPNYDKYWVPDSDAVNSIDNHEAMLWFRSRGDECLNCEDVSLFMPSRPLIIRVHKPASENSVSASK